VRNSHYSANQAFLKLSPDMAICCFAHTYPNTSLCPGTALSPKNLAGSEITIATVTAKLPNEKVTESVDLHDSNE